LNRNAVPSAVVERRSAHAWQGQERTSVVDAGAWENLATRRIMT
jgi:hypothetical protein